MHIFFLSFFLPLILSEGEQTPAPITISLSKGMKVQEVTNTLLYTIEKTNFTTIVTYNNGQPVFNVTESSHIVYIPTILMYLKAISEAPNPTLTVPPQATIKLKAFFLKPGILVGVTFAILFLVGVIYTSLCRKPQAARRPKPTKTNRGVNDDAFNRAKSKRAGAHTRSAGGAPRSTRSGSGAGRSTRSGTGHSHHGSTHGGTRPSSRGGSSSRGARSARGRTSSRL